MGATYTRQSSYTDGDVVQASDTNDEFDQLAAAFVAASGHSHDGTTAEGGPITKLLGTSITIGNAASGTDITVTFDGESNDGVLKWMEDEDYFEFSDDILVASTEKIQFRDTAIYINSSADGQLDLVADTEIQIAATTVDINGNVDVSGTLTVAGAVDFGDAALSNVGAVQLDSIAGDSDTNTSITFSGSDVITVATGGTTSFTVDASQNILMSAAKKVQFRDTALTINSSTDGQMDIDADTELEITAPIVDINASTAVLVSNDLKLDSDAAVLGFGADNDVTLTHVADTGLLLNSTMALQFNDASQSINAPSATVLDINATDEIELNATLVDANANLDVSGTYTGGGLMTTGGNIVIPDSGNIGSASDTDAIAIASNGQVTLTQTLIGTALDISGDIDIDGTTNLDVVDIDGAVDMASTLQVDGVATFTGRDIHSGGITIANAGQIGSVGDADAIAIASDGVVTLTQKLVGTELDISGDIDVDGTTNLDVVDIDGAVDMATTLAVAGNVDFNGDLDVDGTTNLDNTDIDGTLVVDGSNISLDSTSTLNIDNSNTTNGITIGTATSGVPVSIGHTTSETTINDNLSVTGNFTVNGTTTTVNSTTVTIDDPIFTLGGDSAPGSDDNKDRGIEFRYHDGSAARVGFFGYDDSASAFTFLTAATNSSEVFSGTIGNVTAGVGTFASLDISGDIDVDGTTNLDVVDIDGAVDMASTLTVTGAAILNGGIDVAGDITLDAGGADILFKDDGTTFGSIINASSDFQLNANVQDKDIIFTGNDGGSGITALTLDMSAAGAATFNDKITAVGTSVFTNLDISGDIDVDGTTNLDVVDIDGAVNMATTALVTGVLTTTAATVFNGGFASNAASTISTADNTDTLQLISTDADANVGPNLRLYRNSSSPADSDTIGVIDFEGRNDNSQDIIAARINVLVDDVSDGTEDATLFINTMLAGSVSSRIKMTPTETAFNDDSKDLDFRVETNGEANAFLINGGAETATFGVPVTFTDGIVFDNWTITESGGALLFATGGTNKMKLDASGNLTIVGDLNANGSI